MGHTVRIIAASSKVIGTNSKYDIVFVHGIGSNATTAWTNTDKVLWPIWLDHSVEDARTYLLEYPAPIFFYGTSSSFDISDRAYNIADYLASIQVGERPIVFVCHSLGGLLAKEILRVSTENWKLGNIAKNTHGVIFLATPHRGSPSALWASAVGSQLAQDLLPDSNYLMELRDWFSEFCAKRTIYVSGYAEGWLTKGIRVVSAESADPNVHDCRCVSLDADHFSIAKPTDQSADTYTRVLRDIKASIKRSKMNQLPATIEEIASLPILTDDLHDEIVAFLKKKYRSFLPGAVLLSNVSANTNSCIILTQNELIIREAHALELRWPARFKVEKGILGQFTSKDKEDKALGRKTLAGRTSVGRGGKFEINNKVSKKNTSASYVTSSRDGITVTISARESKDLAEFVASKVRKESSHLTRIACFRYSDDHAELFTSFHTIQYSFSRSVTEKLREVVSDRQNNPPGIAHTISKIEPRLFEHFNEVASRSIAQLMKEALSKSFKILVNVGSEQEESQSADESKNYVSVEATVKKVDFSRDIAVLSVKDISKWRAFAVRKELSNLLLHAQGNSRSTLDVGDFVSMTTSVGKKLKVASLNETVYFPMPDKVTCLRSVMVLEGGDVNMGSSGSPIFDEDGLVAGMIIGRSDSSDGPRVLAVDLSKIDDVESTSQLRLT